MVKKYSLTNVPFIISNNKHVILRNEVLIHTDNVSNKVVKRIHRAWQMECFKQSD